MTAVDLSEKLLMEIAGWEAVKQARALLARGAVLSSNWTPPILRGVVQEGPASYRAGLVIKSTIDVENMCGCRQSRQWGTICPHSVAAALDHLKREQTPRENSARPPSSRAPAPRAERRLRRTREDGGEPAALFVIFPPNLTQAIEKDKVTLFFEAEWNGRRTPLNALPQDRTFQFSTLDNTILDELESLAGGEVPAMLMLGGAAFGALLPKLAGHENLTLGKNRSLEVSREPWRAKLSATLEDSGEIRLRLHSTPPPTLAADKAMWVLEGETFRPLALPREYEELLRGPMRLSRAHVPKFLSQDWPQLQAGFDLDANFSPEEFVLAPQPPKFLLHLTGGLAQLQAQLQCAYGPRIMTVGVTARDESLWLPDPADPKRYATRDWPAEQNALARLSQYGFAGPDAQGRYQLPGQNQVLAFFARQFPRLEREWEVTLEERLERSTEKNLERIQPRFEVTASGVNWFDLDVSFNSRSGEQFSTADIQRLLRSGQSHTRLRNGRIAIIDTGAVEELQEVLLDCSPRQQHGKYRIDAAQAGFLEATVREQGNWQILAPDQWRDRVRRQRGEAKMECPPLGDLDTVLRPYQKAGVGWLRFLRQNGFGGILADEMGLGKTLQTLAWIQCAHAPEFAADRKLPTLVVCPTSLVFNWVAEAQKFTPDLKVLALTGPQRHQSFHRIAESDLIVTSYALIRRDAARYREFEFDTVVLDEAQHIKNRQTQNAQAVKGVRARHRLVLTGTPLENSVLDLWSIYDFLMPGYLGSAQDFRERYEIPIVREKDAGAQARLARRIRPFLLRRLKREVAAELPEKIEQVAFCELTGAQRAVYQQVVEASRKEVFEAVGAHGVAKSRMLVLNALLRLRQICCDLRLLNLENVDPGTASGKVDLFSELMQEVIDGGHRVLVFSQFVSMLHVLQDKLSSEDIQYCYLDGSTSNRAEVVGRFQSDSSIPVFLISLKAGGVGLNLTGADTVIHFDPWWNPAVEDQAADRAHRIGQTRVVTSYKLITRGTVEEKILSLQTRKREVIQATLAGEDGLAGALSWEDIQDLFS